MSNQEDPVQREIHQDWANREYIEVITSSIKKIADFLNSFAPSYLSRKHRLIPTHYALTYRTNSVAQHLWHLNEATFHYKNSKDMSCRSRLATLNEKLTALERRIEYIEARVTKGETLT